MEHAYSLLVKHTENRRGILTSSEFSESIQVATPPPFQSGESGFWSPEHLFTAAVSSCFMTTFLAIAENFKLSFDHFKCKAEGKMSDSSGKFRMDEVLLFPEITISDPSLKDKVEKIIDKSEKACLISNSILTKVVVIPKIVF